MDFWKKRRQFAATMKSCKGKTEKNKKGSSQDTAEKPVINFDMDVELTSRLCDALDPRIRALIKVDGTKDQDKEYEIPVNSIDVTSEAFPVVLKVFSKNNFSKESKPVWSRGGAPDDDAAYAVLKKIVIRGDCAVMVVSFKIRFGHDAWKWGGDCIGGGECVIETLPLQQELAFEGKDEKEGKDDDDKDPGEKIADKKAKEAKK